MKQCVLVVGAGPTGTSILARLLGAHSKIHAIPGETGFLYRGRNGPKAALESFDAQAGDKQYWLEKTPMHIKCVRSLWDLRPQAKVINMIRDPRDTMCSYLSRGFKPNIGARRWVDHNKAFLNLVPDKRLKVVGLEALVTSPKEVLTEVLTFLGLTYEDLTDYYKQPVKWYSNVTPAEKPKPTAHRSFRNWQINQPLFESTVRWPKDLSKEAADELRKYKKPIMRMVEASIDSEIVEHWVGLKEFLESGD